MCLIRGDKAEKKYVHDSAHIFAIKTLEACMKTMKHVTIAPLIAALLAMLPAAMPSGAQTDDFNDDEDDGWTRYSPLAPYGAPGIFTLNNGQYRIQATASPMPGVLGPGRAGSLLNNYTQSVFRIAVDIVAWDDSLDQVFGLLARVTQPGLGSLNGYVLTYANEQGTASATLSLIRVSGEVPVITMAETNILLNPNQRYRMVMTGIGASFRGEIYALSNLSTPLAVLNGSDNAYPEGIFGFFVYDNSPSGNSTADATFDNFTIGEPSPPLASELLPLGDIQVSWPDWATGFQLQWRTNLMTGSWNTVPGPYNQSDGRFYYIEDAREGRRFFRLLKIRQ